MERAFGSDFDGVRIHTGSHAPELNDRIQAKAFTVGNDIYFRDGAPDTGSAGGQHLLAHELTHTIQQGENARRSPAERIQRWSLFGKKKKVSQQEPPAEISGPTNGRSMTTAEQGGAKSAREVIEMTELRQARGDQSLDPDLATKHLTQVLIPGTTRFHKLTESGELGGGFSAPRDLTKEVGPETTVSGVTGHLFEVGGTQYFVAADDVKPLGWISQPDQPIFPLDPSTGQPRAPRADDVKQGGLGDCYLEAALASLVQSNPGFVRSMLTDHGRTVSVRMFDVDMSDPDKPAFTPRTVKVTKSVAGVSNDRLYDGGALWVSMIEKAYAVARYAGRASKEPAHQQRASASMQSIAGGKAHHALMHLTGLPATTVKVSSGAGDSKAAMGRHAPWSRLEYAEWLEQRAAGDSGSYVGLLVFQYLISSKMTMEAATMATDKFMRWVPRHADEFDALEVAAGLRPGDAMTSGYHGEIRLEDIEAIFEGTSQASTWTAMRPFLAKSFPGKRGTDSYTDEQRRAFKEITDGLAAGKPMTASSRKKQTRGAATETGHSGGEAMGGGVVGGHAYSITAAEERDGGALWVQLRNPWRNYTREYDDDGAGRLKGKAARTGTGTFWIELSDFTKRFYELGVGSGMNG
jgi:hypothetical protein